MKIKTKELSGVNLDYAVAEAIGRKIRRAQGDADPAEVWSPSTKWADGGPLIAEHNITLIRADNDYAVGANGFTTNRAIPRWWGECDRWVGHGLSGSWEGEYQDPSFIVCEDRGIYGTTPLEAAMRALVSHKLGAEVDIPGALK